MSLPYPGKVYVPFDILTAQELNEDVANIESLAAGTGINDAVISYDKINTATSMPYGTIGFATYGTGGGWASGIATEQTVPFDTLVTGAIGVTKPTNGQLQLTRAGNYTISLMLNAVAGSGNVIHRIEYSTDGGGTWKWLTPYINPVPFEAGRGQILTVRQYFPANTRIKATNFATNNVRFAANGATDLSSCSLTAAM